MYSCRCDSQILLSDKYLLNTYKGPGYTVGNKAETLTLDLTLKNETFCVSKFSK